MTCARFSVVASANTTADESKPRRMLMATEFEIVDMVGRTPFGWWLMILCGRCCCYRYSADLQFINQ